MQLFCCHYPGQAFMQLFKLVCLVFWAGDQNTGILWGTQLPKKMIAWAFKKLELHLIVNSRLLSGLRKTLWNELRHLAIHILRMVPAKISRAPLRHGGAHSQTENWNYQRGFVGFQAGVQTANIPADKLKNREQQNHQGSLLGTCSVPIFYSFGVDKH